MLRATNMSHHRRAVSGQAMTEFNVSVAFIFMPLFVLVPTLGKLIEIQHTNQLAARYAAWERTVWFDTRSGGANRNDFVTSSNEWESVAVRDESTVANTMRNRFFLRRDERPFAFISDSDTAPLTEDVQRIWFYEQSDLPMYNETELLRYSNSDVEETPGVAYWALKGFSDGVSYVMEPLNDFRSFTGNSNEDWMQFPLFRDSVSYYRPIVKTSLNKSNAQGGGVQFWDRTEGSDFTNGIESAIFLNNGWDGTFESQAAILADGWSAQSEAHYKDRADDYAIMDILDIGFINDVVIPLVAILEGGLENSAIGKFEFGAVGIEPMPLKDGEPAPVECEDGFCTFDE